MHIAHLASYHHDLLLLCPLCSFRFASGPHLLAHEDTNYGQFFARPQALELRFTASWDSGAITYDSGRLTRCIHPQASLDTYHPSKRPDNAMPPPRGFYKA
ncbi:hypothetical protein BD779DRAFT_347363 [Infundibulicybe gibba]|nr:hypothetical protein BD779DRAFT_347363 [Infundibulicybe gibba]